MNPNQPPGNELGFLGELKAIYGPPVDKLWYRIMATRSQARKARLLQRLELHAAEVQHKGLNNRKIRLAPPPANVISEGEYELGKVIFPAVPPYPVTLAKKEFLQHCLFDGRSGTGKTTLILNLMEQVQADGIAWLALDWKGSFGVLMHAKGGEDVIVLTIESDAAPLRINMLLPPPGVNTNAWVENLTETIGNNHMLLDGAQSSLKNGLHDAIREHGNRATLRDALFHVRRQKVLVMPRSREYGWIESTERALVQLTTGQYGDCVNERDHPMLVGELLTMKVSIDLRGLGQAQGATLCTFFLQTTLLTRQKQQGPREVLQHITLLDEAQHVFRPESPWEPLTLASRVIREVREFGECIIAASQGVRLSESLLNNTGTQAVMRTNSKAELDHFSKSFQVNPLDLASIPIGQAIGIVPGRWPRPFLFSFRENKLKNQIVNDEEITERYNNWRSGKPLHREAVQAIVSEKDLALLSSIAGQPLLSITQHYDALRWNPKIGNNTKDRLLRAGLIRLEEIHHGRAHKKFPILTNNGEKLMIEKNIPITSIGPRSVEHEHWRKELRSRCEAHNYTVIPEHRLGNGRVDLYATKEERTLLIEIETGKSDVIANINKCQGHGQLLLFFTTTAAYKKHERSIPADVIALTPNTIDFLHQLLN